MKANVFKILMPLSITGLIVASCSHQYESDLLNLTTYQWDIWPDTAAEWKDDSLYLPPVDISTLPENPPTCGWEELHRGIGKLVRIPATVDGQFQGETAHDYGISGDQAGVYWFHTRFTLPGLWNEKRILLKFGGARFRTEVYLNEQLVGYELVNGTPFELDVTGVIYYTRDNHLSVRITDPVGNSTHSADPDRNWGNIELPPALGPGGITGPVHVVVSDEKAKGEPERSGIRDGEQENHQSS
ncbi:MAG: hypothetical protein EHM46_03465 [Bacteroidetes bacterium]|nr:MAG: hypothetical protein EHM46_03465 [Bacteroidota bacterium]